MLLKHRFYVLLLFLTIIYFYVVYLYISGSIFIESASYVEPINFPQDFIPNCKHKNYTYAAKYRQLGQDAFHLGLENRVNCLRKWQDLNLEDSVFVPIDVSRKVYAYTAYLDERNNPNIIRVLLYKPSNYHVDVYCHIFDTHSDDSIDVIKSTKVTGTGTGLHMLSGHFDGNWRGFYANCPVNSPKFSLPSKMCLLGVSIDSKPTNLRFFNSTGGKLLPLRSTEPISGEKINRALCVRSLYNSVSIPPARIIEFLEFTFRLGVELIVWYIGEIPAKHVHNVLQLYMNKPIRNESTGKQLRIVLIPWFLPDHNTYAFSQPLMTNDCSFRLISSVNYIQFNDFDEFMVPTENFADMDKAIEQHFTEYPKLSVMCLDNVYFPNSLMSKNELPRSDIRLYIKQSKIRCKYLDKLQTKCLIKPRGILEMLVHKPLLTSDAKYSAWGIVGTENLARSHHLRQPPTKYCDIHSENSLTMDLSMQRFIPPNWKQIILQKLDNALLNC